MKINSSSVAMASSRSYHETTAVSTSSVLLGGRRVSDRWNVNGNSDKAGQGSNKNNATVSLSERSRKLLEQLKQEQKDRQMAGAEKMTGARQEPVPRINEDTQIEALKQLLEALKQMREALKNGDWNFSSIRLAKQEMKGTTGSVVSNGFRVNTSANSQISLAAGGIFVSGGGGASAANGVWTRQTVVSTFHSETENTAFSTTGVVKTADGREINFNVQVEMSRSFLEANEFIKEDTVKIMTDPLVINLDTNVANVTDQKFLFDLDTDGKLDEISFVGQGSGFLALDQNHDGKINDGSELFGTKSGNGFEDLAAYDQDGNGWIDEADSIFHKLVIWTKDENGEDKLIGLGKAGIGAIYLGSASTDFTLKNAETNETNGQIRRTGVYLKENGEAGTIQHVDLAL